MISHRPSSAARLAAGAALGLALAVTAAPAVAQDNDGAYWLARKNHIVVTATRIATKAEDVPATVTVKTDEQMADELVTDIRDLVRFEPGVSVQRQPRGSTRRSALRGARATTASTSAASAATAS